MHGSFEAIDLESLPFEDVLRLDRALRHARETVLAFGKLGDALWSILLELAATRDGLDFDTLEDNLSASHGQTAMLACLSTLEEAGLVRGDDNAQLPLLSHVHITALGRSRIDAVLATALVVLRRKG